MPKGKQREKVTRWNLVTGQDTYSSQSAQDPGTARKLQSLIPALSGDLTRELADPSFLASVGAKIGFLFDFNRSNGDGTNTHFYFVATATQIFLDVNGVWTAQSLPMPPDPPATPTTSPLHSFPQAIVINNMMHLSDGTNSWVYNGSVWLLEGFPIPLLGPTFVVANGDGGGLTVVTNRYYWFTWADETVGSRFHESSSSPGIGGGNTSQGAFAPATAAAAGGGIAWSNPNNIKVSDAAYATAVLAPQGPTNTGAFGPHAEANTPVGFGFPWTNLGNVETQDSVNADAGGGTPGGAQTDNLDVSNFGFGIPLNATILGVAVQVVRSGTNNVNAAVEDAYLAIFKGGTGGTFGTDKSDQISTWPASPAAANYGGSVDLWGLALSPAEVNDSGFGMRISAFLDNIPGDNISRMILAHIDYISITVYYSIPGGLSQELQATGFNFNGATGFNIPGSAQILGIKVEILRARTAGTGSIQDNDVTILKNGNPVVGGNRATAIAWPGAEAFATYGSVTSGSFDLWGTTWTPGDINSALFGVQISAIETTGVSATAGVDFIRITVAYSTTAGTGAFTNGSVTVTRPPNPPVRATHWHLYASESENSQIGYLLASIPVGTTTYRDLSPFIGAAGSLFSPIERPVRNDPPVPSKIQEVHKYRVFRRRETKPANFNFTANEEVSGNLNGSPQESTPGTDPNTISDIVNENPYPNQSLGIRGIRSHGDALYIATEKDITPMYGQSITDFTLSQITAFKLGLAGRYAWDSTPHGLAFISYDKKAMLYPSQFPAGLYGSADTTSTLIEIGRPLRKILKTIKSSDLENVRTVFYNYNARNWWVIAFQDNTSAYQTWVFDFETQGWFQLQRGVSSLAVFEVSPGNIVLVGGDASGQVWVLDDITGSFSASANLPAASFRPALIDWQGADHYHIFRYVEFEVSNILLGSSSITLNYWLDPADVDNPGAPTGTLNIAQVKGSNFFRAFPKPGTLCYRMLLEVAVASDQNSGILRGLNIVADPASSLIL